MLFRSFSGGEMGCASGSGYGEVLAAYAAHGYAAVCINYFDTAKGSGAAPYVDEAARIDLAVREATTGPWARAYWSGEDLLLDIDVQGAAKVRQRLPEAVSIFILPPSRAEMETRLRKRGQDAEEVIAKRLRDAQREIKNVGQYDYVLINDQLDRSAEALRAIVQCERHRLTGSGIQGDGAKIRALAESCRTAAQRERVAPILEGFRD